MAGTGAGSDKLGYAGKRVVVTGCSSGIGRATAKLMLEAGARVHGIDWREPDFALSAFTQADLRSPEAINHAAETVAGPIDALFNCAGLAPMHDRLDIMRVNFIGTRLLSEALIGKMPPGGAISAIGSNGGSGWRRRLPQLKELIAARSFDDAVRWCEAHGDLVGKAYNFSKEAIVVWTLAWSADTIARGVRINCIAPGTVQTPMLVEIEGVMSPEAIDVVSQPIGRRSSPEEQAWVLLMLNSERASYINGVELPVDGGFIAAQMIARGEVGWD